MPDGGRDAGRDAGQDAGRDGGQDPCANGTRDGSESDVDCGGSCAPCGQCRRCNSNTDCAGNDCTSVDGSMRCRVVPANVPVMSPTGMVPAFVRERDGAVLLAWYGAGLYRLGYDPNTAQLVNTAGGGNLSQDWAPWACSVTRSGHAKLDRFTLAGRRIEMECGQQYGDPSNTRVSGSLISSTTSGTFGTVGAPGSPGWAALASVSSDQGRAFSMCGADLDTDFGGIAYCSGPGATNDGDYGPSLVSWTVDGTSVSALNPYVGCGGMGCNGATCDLQVWVWLLPP
ncbi:MAG: hypothetical protein K8H88_27765 [Sandaracinaceae bacterium]|nr:hypothetical protein [Sandaracinaceae bacterium]